ncbi:TolC family protein [Stieleria neptunia]|nr:TolC family protein [Stieleria neptunia]
MAQPQALPPAEYTFQLSLDEAIGLGLSQNPDLAAVRATEPVASAAMGVANTYIYNPQFQTQVLPYSRDRNGEDGSVSQQHVVVQTFELGGQQQHREGMAAANWRQVHNTVNQAELLNMAQTTRFFFAALYQRELRDLNAALAEMNEQIIGVIERREKAGQSNKADVELAKLQYRATLRQQRLAEAGYQTAMLSLRNQLNFAPDATIDLAGKWTNWQWQPLDVVVGMAQPMMASEEPIDHLQLDSLDDAFLRQLVANRPDVLAARSAVSMASENMRLADAMRCPSLQGGPMFQRDDSSTVFWGVQAQIDIPVVNNGKPLVQQRLAELRQQQITATQLENRAVLEARAAIQRYERARRLVEQSRADFDRDLNEALQPFEDQFKAGQINLLQVFAARTTLIQSQQGFFDLLNELTLAMADVTQATGMQPQMLVSMTESVATAENATLEMPSSKDAESDKKDAASMPKTDQAEASSLKELLQP